MEETAVFALGQSFTIGSSAHTFVVPSPAASSSASAPTRSASVAKRGGGAGTHLGKPKRAKHRTARSRFVGVRWDASAQAWRACLERRSGRRTDLGIFGRESDAARAYDAAVVAQQLDLKLNFPLNGASPGGSRAGARGSGSGKRHARHRQRAKASRFTGVRWDAVTKAWSAHAVVHLAVTLLGHFEREDDAARAYNAFVVVNGLDHPRNAVKPAESGERARALEALPLGASPSGAARLVPVAAPAPSPFTSAVWDATRGQWRTTLDAPGKLPQVEYFADDLSAARAFDTFALVNNLARDTSFALLSAEEREMLASMTPASVAKARAKAGDAARASGRAAAASGALMPPPPAPIAAAAAAASDAADPGLFLDAPEVGANKKKRKHVQRSRFPGVRWSSAKGQWVAEIIYGGARTHIGYYDFEHTASHAVKTLERRCVGGGAIDEASDDKMADGVFGSSRYVCVSWARRSGKWRATIRHEGKTHHLGVYDDEDDAARAVDFFVVSHNVDRPLNFKRTANKVRPRATFLFCSFILCVCSFLFLFFSPRRKRRSRSRHTRAGRLHRRARAPASHRYPPRAPPRAMSPSRRVRQATVLRRRCRSIPQWTAHWEVGTSPRRRSSWCRTSRVCCGTARMKRTRRRLSPTVGRTTWGPSARRAPPPARTTSTPFAAASRTWSTSPPTWKRCDQWRATGLRTSRRAACSRGTRTKYRWRSAVGLDRTRGPPMPSATTCAWRGRSRASRQKAERGGEKGIPS